MTHRIPKSFNAQGACSREDPHPKFSPLHTRRLECFHGSLLSTKSGSSSPVLTSYRIGQNKAAPRPVRSRVLRNCLGMILSVSMFDSVKGAATPLTMLNFGRPAEAAAAYCSGVVSVGVSSVASTGGAGTVTGVRKSW